MFPLALLVLAQGTEHTQEPPSDGVGIVLILGTLVAIAVLAALIFFVVSRRTKASRGGVEPRPQAREAGTPPFESVDREL